MTYHMCIVLTSINIYSGIFRHCIGDCICRYYTDLTLLKHMVCTKLDIVAGSQNVMLFVYYPRIPLRRNVKKMFHKKDWMEKANKNITENIWVVRATAHDVTNYKKL